MATKLKRNRPAKPKEPSLRCALCLNHPKQFGSIGVYVPKDVAKPVQTYILCAACAKTVGRNPTPAQMARIESYITS